MENKTINLENYVSPMDISRVKIFENRVKVTLKYTKKETSERYYRSKFHKFFKIDSWKTVSKLGYSRQSYWNNDIHTSVESVVKDWIGDNSNNHYFHTVDNDKTIHIYYNPHIEIIMKDGSTHTRYFETMDELRVKFGAIMRKVNLIRF